MNRYFLFALIVGLFFINVEASADKDICQQLKNFVAAAKTSEAKFQKFIDTQWKYVKN